MTIIVITAVESNNDEADDIQQIFTFKWKFSKDSFTISYQKLSKLDTFLLNEPCFKINEIDNVFDRLCSNSIF